MSLLWIQWRLWLCLIPAQDLMARQVYSEGHPLYFWWKLIKNCSVYIMHWLKRKHRWCLIPAVFGHKAGKHNWMDEVPWEVAGRSHRAGCESKNSWSEITRETQRVGNLFSCISSFLPFSRVFVFRALCRLVSFLSPEEVSTALLSIRWGRQRLKTSWLHPGQGRSAGRVLIQGFQLWYWFGFFKINHLFTSY